ncbi:oxoglutarate dehydrogenase inhibitor-like [Lolium rigidum]|uniref:oxoglutarate dehydrogenase inhibitor-like n=1 Tax=Lolium rigidum TaxID=89674 RepID=UPI001F5CDB99|nr:oxoglutarate dehydrogenase inhibitor-like [Lolium rigidum]XP_047087553.1 oxoglutarate dehydrogenase inhibitor-like [Lolium rigidum]
MEAAAATSSPLLSLSGARRSPTLLRCSPASARPPPYRCSYYTGAERQLVYLARTSSRGLSLRCSAAAAGSTSTEGWLLEPAGDGDWKHIGYRVERRGPIEITSSDVVTVGRVPESADIVIPVATVSGVHARLEKKKDGSLVVTDMNSTNGTYINERKLVPGFPVAVNSGSLLIFGDIHLAMFRARKALFQVPAADETVEDNEQEVNNEVLASVTEETS